MNAIKGGWVGQTFALAKCNDSRGKKSRVRRSKEERKAMVESFIKKYQNSNNGNFPSLNLTHKEVGGSFYTVREIVREIIQENRVLGPAKLNPAEQGTDQLSEQYPLGSISMKPLAHFSFSSNGTHLVPNEHSNSEELVLTSSEQDARPEHQEFDSKEMINGSWTDEKKEESAEMTYKELEVGEMPGTNIVDELEASVAKVPEKLEAKKNIFDELEASMAKLSPVTADVFVETFPLRSVDKPTNSFNGRSGEVEDLNGTLEEKGTQEADLEPGNCSPVLGGSTLEKSSGLVGEKAITNLGGPSMESSNLFTPEESNADVLQNGTNLGVKVLHDVVLSLEKCEGSPAITENKPISAPNGTHNKNLDDANNVSDGNSVSQEAVVIENMEYVQTTGNSQEGSHPTLDRIKLTTDEFFACFFGQ